LERRRLDCPPPIDRRNAPKEISVDFQLRPLTLDLNSLQGLSPRLIASHHENNYTGAVKRLNAIRKQLGQLDWAAAPVFMVNGLKREELIAANSAWLHELYFDGLGGDGAIGPQGLATVLERDFASFDHWRAEFIALAKAMGGGSGWALLSWSSREGRLINHWAADHTHLLAGATPILALDMYEHAYHMDFGAKAAAYVDAFMGNVRWEATAKRFAATVASDAAELGVAPAAVAGAPQLVDVRKAQAFAEGVDVLAGATWRDPVSLPSWATELDRQKPVLVYCRHGAEISRSAALSLLSLGYDARYVIGGIEGCRAAGATMTLKP
jgi:superoxide dismutase, Fe-Mn family